MLISIGIVFATVAAVFAIYALMRVLMSRAPNARTQDLAASVVFRVSALHGLVLALVFASEVVEYNQLSFESASEVNAISDIYFDSMRYGEGTEAIRTAMRAYLDYIPTEEWNSLGRTGDLSGSAWVAWDDAYTAILDLTPASPRQDALRDNMLDKIHAIAENRDMREYQAKTGLNVLFWIAAIVGVVMVSAGYYTFAPTRDNVILLSIFSAYTGFILFTIYAMSNPFSDPAALKPRLFFELRADIAKTE